MNAIIDRIKTWWNSLMTTPTPPVAIRSTPDHNDGAEVIAPPPVIDGVTLRDWMIHTHIRTEETWQAVVAEFYHRVQQDDEIVKAYFSRPGLDLLDLQRHFMRALVVVSHVGLTRRAADTLGDKHAHLGIQGEHFDRVVNVLTDVLADYRVPRDYVLQLVPVVVQLRKRIVTA